MYISLPKLIVFPQAHLDWDEALVQIVNNVEFRAVVGMIDEQILLYFCMKFSK